MISLEQIRLLESKITRALELIHVLKEENSTLRKGLESAQKRMKELESLVDGFKTDQSEIETVIVRTLHTLDELEEDASSAKRQNPGSGSSPIGAPGGSSTTPGSAPAAPVRAEASAVRHAEVQEPPPSPALDQDPVVSENQPRTPKEELDIF